MKRLETNACLIAGVLATSILLTGCGGGSGGGMSGLGAAGAAGATGAAGAAGTNLAGTVDNLTALLGSDGITLDANIPGVERVNLNALSSADLARLQALGITGSENIELLRASDGAIIGINSPAGAFGVPGASLPAGLPTLPALPTNIGGVLSGITLPGL